MARAASDDERLHVVLWGAGALGLGLVGDMASQAGLPLMVAARKNGSSSSAVKQSLDARRAYVVGSNLETQHRVPIEDLFWVDNERGLSSFIEAVSEIKNVFFAVSARASGQFTAANIIRVICQKRADRHNRGIFLLAPCENSVTKAVDRLRSDLAGPGFVYLDMMVDRICQPPMLRAGHVDVWAERRYEWAAEPVWVRTGNVRRFGQVASDLSDLQLIVQPSIETIKLRKRFLMNGVQTCLAILTKHRTLSGNNAEHLFIREYLDARPNDLSELLREFSLAVTATVGDAELPSGELESLAAWYGERILESAQPSGGSDGDSVGRILSRYQSATMAAGIADLLSKVGEARDILVSEMGDVSDTLIDKAFRLGLGTSIDP